MTPSSWVWPPLAVAFAGGLLIGLPALYLALVLVVAAPWEAVAVATGWLLVAGPAPAGLLRGRLWGYWWSAGLVLLGITLVAGSTAYHLFNGGGLRPLVGQLPPTLMLGTTALLLWWPETRRWCGLLPPADADE